MSRPKNDHPWHDWNAPREVERPQQPFDVFDETLRDGLQSVSAVNPSLEDKLQLVELMEKIGVGGADIGLPGAGARVLAEVVAIARHAERRGLALKLACAARTVPADVARIVEASQQSGRALTVYTFIGSSPIRQWVEGWDRAFLVRTSRAAIELAVREGLEVAYVTEDTTRSSPHDLDVLFRAALDLGVRRLVLCDTVGHATPAGARALVTWTRRLIDRVGADAKVDWHGHDDRGLGVANGLAAIAAGAHRVHGCGIGIGERVGNASLDRLLVNMKLMGWQDSDEGALRQYVHTVSRACGVPIPDGYPIFGKLAARALAGDGDLGEMPRPGVVA